MGQWRYGVIMDAGSSGTRVYIYRWLNSDLARETTDKILLEQLPHIETDKKWQKKTHPGISTYGKHPHDVGPNHLEDLLEFAREHVPVEDVPNTPLFLLATAGMRLLPDSERKSVLKEVCDYARKTTQFQLPDCDLHVQVIAGETEGLYGWIAANYLLGGFDKPKDHNHGKGHHTYGFLDMGGASAQIAFAPNATEAEKHADNLTLMRLRTVDGTPLEYKVFVSTWLGFGANEARRRYLEQLWQSSPGSKEFPDPCLPVGLMVDTKGNPITSSKSSEPHLLGTGKFTECIHQTYPLLEKDKECLDMPCLLNGQHAPAIDFDVNHFVGVSEYWHTTHEIFDMGHKDKAYDFKKFQDSVNEFCSQDWKAIEKQIGKHKWGKKVDAIKAQEVCFKASWLINMLHDGIGVPRVGLEASTGTTNTTKQSDSAKPKGYLDPFQAVNKIDDVEVSWTLGKMVLYAASEVPPSASPEIKDLAVGFGANVPNANKPQDAFQEPGGSYQPYIHTRPWHRNILSEKASIAVLLLILCFIGFLALGRDRRQKAFQKASTTFSNLRGKSGFRKLGRRPRPKSYERVLEEGDAVDDFELAHLEDDDEFAHSDSSEASSRVGRSSGWATPQTRAGIVEPGSVAPQYFDDGASGSSKGLGSSPSAQRGTGGSGGGLLLRTESRDRLARGRKSRPASPSRLRSQMGKLKESTD